MSYLTAAVIGLLVAVGVLMLLHKNTIRMIIGMYIIWNAANLLVISTAVVRGGHAPLAQPMVDVHMMTDPLVQALVLTAIVITFGFMALLVAITIWLSGRGDSINIQDFNESKL